MRFKCPVFILLSLLVLVVNMNNVFGLDEVIGVSAADIEDRSNNAGELSDGIPTGFMLIEGDIIVPENFFMIKAAYRTNLWTNNQVPYEFDTDFTIPPPPDVATGVTTVNRLLIQAAMQEWENASAINFVHCPLNNCTGNYLHIQNSTGNNSFVRMVGGEQVVNIFNWNIRFIMVHELGHALGYWHEHQRGDSNCFATNFVETRPIIMDHSISIR